MAVIMGRNIWGRALLRARSWCRGDPHRGHRRCGVTSPNGIVNTVTAAHRLTTDPFYSRSP